MARRILGLDIGSHTIKAVELQQTLRGMEVVQMRSMEIDHPSPSLSTELRDFTQMHDLPADFAVVRLAGDRISTRRLSFPFRDRRKIGPAVPFEVESQVPFDLDDYFVDWEIVREEKDRTEVSATLAPRSEVALMLEILREAEITPRIVEAEGLVLSNLSTLFDLPGTRLVADVGHRKTTLCLILDGRAIAARTFPLGGRAITEAISSERGIGEVEAERVKTEQGVLGGPGRHHSEGGSAVVDKIAREILRTLGSTETLLGDLQAEPVRQVDLIGGTARLHRLDEVLSERLGVHAAKLALPEGEIGTQIVAGGDPLLFGPAVALALRGSGKATTRMNFRQEELAHRVDFRQVGRELRWTAVLAGAVALLGLGSLATEIGLDSGRAERFEGEARALVQQALPGSPPPTNALAAMQSAVRNAQKRADTLGVYRGNLSALDLLTEISNRVPTDVEVVFEELSIDRGVIQIKGHSPSFGSIDRLRAQLAEFEPFSKITVGDITSDAKRGGQNFNVRISLAAGGDLS